MVRRHLVIGALLVVATTTVAQDTTAGRRGRGGRGRPSADTLSAPKDTAGARRTDDAKAGDPKGVEAKGGDTKSGDAKGAGGRSGRGGPRSASIVLGPTDVYRVTRAPIDATIPVSGDLRAFDNATVRTRIDGVIEKVMVREGQVVQSGALLAKFESSEQEATQRSAEADVAAAKSDAETQEWNAEQSRDLFKRGAIAERDQRLADQAADAAKARLAASEARLKTAINGVRDTRILAPFAGTIEKRLVQDGENTPRGTQLFTMVRTTTLELLGSVPARSADEVKVGQTVRFSADGRSFTGRVARVSPTIDPASRSVAVYVTVQNPNGMLKGNTFATGQLVTTTVPDALVIPAAAIRDNVDGTRRYVYLIKGDELAQSFIRTGIVDDSRGVVQVLDGVKEADQVVVGNPGTLGQGMKVTVIGDEGGRGGRGGMGGRRGQKSTP